MGDLKQKLVCRIFTKVNAASALSKELQKSGVYADIINTDNVAKLVFIADSIEDIAPVLKAANVTTYEYVDPNLMDYNETNRDKAWIKKSV